MLVGGLMGYNYLALGFPGATEWIATGAGVNGILLLTFLGEMVGGILALLWMRNSSEPESRAG
jgi:hypothetical protein